MSDCWVVFGRIGVLSTMIVGLSAAALAQTPPVAAPPAAAPPVSAPPAPTAPARPAAPRPPTPADVIRQIAPPAGVPTVAPADSVKAQLEMLARIDEAVKRYAQQIGLDDSFVSFCRTELRIRLQEQVKQDNPVFNFQPERIRTQAALTAVIGIREAYERNFQILCLADAKAKLTVGLPQ